MADRIEQLTKQLKDWLRRNDLDHDLHFWSQTDWRKRGEEYLNGAVFVITTEGQLCFLLNYAFGDEKVEELQDLLSSFGFWFDMGHSWSIGIYSDDSYDTSPTSPVYQDKLRDARWKQKAERVRANAGNQCQDCEAKRKPLDVHHCWYKYGFEPWQYPLEPDRPPTAARLGSSSCTDQQRSARTDSQFR